MAHDDISDRLKHLLGEHLGRDPRTLTPEATLRGTLMLDNLDLVDLALLVGRELGVVAPVEDYRALRSFDALVTFVAERAAGAA